MARRHVPISVIAGLLLLAVALWATLVLAAPGSQAQTAPLFLGPAQGTSSQGSTADTTSFTSQSLSFQPQNDYPGGQPLGRYDLASTNLAPISSPPAGSNEVVDSPSTSAPLPVINGFEGLTDVWRTPSALLTYHPTPSWPRAPTTSWA